MVCSPTTAKLDGKLLARFLERLESKRSDAARCVTLKQLAVRAELGDAAIAVLDKYASPGFSVHVRTCALSAFGYAVSPSAVGSLLKLAAAIEPPLREALVRALASREETAARAGLIALVRDPHSPLRIPAAVALAELGAEDSAMLIEELLQEPGIHPQRLIAALGQSGDPQALGVLQRVLQRSGGMYEALVCSALGDIGSAESTRVLLSMMDSSPSRQERVYRALAHSVDPAAQHALLAAADSGKEAALASLIQVDTPDARAWMLRALEGSDNTRLAAATEYFGRHSDPRAIAGLSRLANSDVSGYGSMAVQTLGNIGGQAACDALEALAASPGPLQAQALTAFSQQPEAAERSRALALMLLDQGDDAPPNVLDVLATDASPEAHAALLRAARRDAEGSGRALSILAKRDDPESLSTLSEIARSERSPNRIMALSALAENGSQQAADVMRDALRSNDPLVREAAVHRFGAFNAPDLEQAMLNASRDQTREVAAAAILELGQLGTAPALERLTHLARDSSGTMASEALQSLVGAAPEQGVAVVDSLITDADSDGLYAALSVASSLPTQATQRVYERALSATDPGVVVHALSQLDDGGSDVIALSAALERLAHDVHAPNDQREHARNLLVASIPEVEVDGE